MLENLRFSRAGVRALFLCGLYLQEKLSLEKSGLTPALENAKIGGLCPHFVPVS
jgi:hypothetical protein